MSSRRLVAARQRTEEGESLRLLSWEELRSRLAAARDLRKVMTMQQSGSDASFAAETALHLKEFEESIPDVNPKTLGNGKASGGRAKRTANEASSDDRGQDD